MVMPKYEEGLGRVLLEGTEEEREAAKKVSEEAWEKSEQAWQKYLETFDRWQDRGCPIDEKAAVDAAWLEYTNAYNAYLEAHRESAGKYGYKHKPPYQRQHT